MDVFLDNPSGSPMVLQSFDPLEAGTSAATNAAVAALPALVVHHSAWACASDETAKVIWR